MHALGTAILHYANPDNRAIAFAQVYSFKAGLKKSGDIGANAANTELTQLHDYKVYNLVKATSLTPTKRKTALKLLMNIVKIRDGRIRACAITDRSKEHRQQGYKKEDGFFAYHCYHQHHDHSNY